MRFWQEVGKLSVGISSTSLEPLTFDLRAFQVPNFTLNLNHTYEVNVSPSLTPILMFSFPPNTEKSDSFLLTVRSGKINRKKCVSVAISDQGCPWNDEHRTLKNNKILSRILSLGYFPLRSEDFTEGFIMIFKATNNSEECSSGPETEQISEKQPKTLTITLTKISSLFWLPVTITLIVFVVLGTFMITVLNYCWHQKKKYQDCRINEHLERKDQDQYNKVELETTITSNLRETHKKGKGSYKLKSQ